MLSKQLLISLSLFVIFGAINAARDMSCIEEATPVENFDSENYFGVFYTYALEDEKRINWACITYVVYPPKPDDSVQIVSLWRDKNRNTTHMELKNAKVDKTGQGVTIDGHKHKIVGTDYEDYIVLFVCDETKSQHIIWALTSDPKPTSEDLAPIKDILEKYNLSLSDLSRVDHEDCPDDWSNAELDAVDFQYSDVELDLIQLDLVQTKQ